MKGCKVKGSGLEVWELRSGVEGTGFRGEDLGLHRDCVLLGSAVPCKDLGVGFEVLRFGLLVCSISARDWGLGFRVQDIGLGISGLRSELVGFVDAR